MKRVLLTGILATALFACNKTVCPGPDPNSGAPAACSDEVPTGEECQAYFKRWFYVKETNRCEEIGYSGCSQKGFATQAECEECVWR